MKLDNLGMELRDYQREILHDLEYSSSRTLLVMPTGTGKTVLFASYALLSNRRTLILVNNDELINQAKSTFLQLDPSADVGTIVGSHREFDNQITIASVLTLKNHPNLIVADDDYELIIYDEAHHITAMSSVRILYRYGLVDLDTAGYENAMLIQPHHSPTRKLIGVTATPDRTDEESLDKVFNDRLDAPSLEWFIQNEYLCDLRFVSIDTGIDLSDVRSYLGDLSESDIAKKLVSSGYISEMSRIISEYCEDRKSILIYVPNVVTAKLCSKLLNESGIPTDFIIGADRGRRSGVISAFKERRLRVIVNVLVAKEGVDIPNIDCILICRPTKSKLLLTQMIGRSTRRADGKDYAKIIDLVFHRRQNDIISASGIFSELEEPEPSEEHLSVRERILLQNQRSSMMARTVHILDRIRHKRSLQEEEELKSKKERQEKEYMAWDVPDSVNLLVDTRMLRALHMSVGEFQSSFRENMKTFFQSHDQGSWMNGEPHENQLDKLERFTGYNREDLSVMNWKEAQILIKIFEQQKPITVRQVAYLRYLGVAEENMPKTVKGAQVKINQILGYDKYQQRRKRRRKK